MTKIPFLVKTVQSVRDRLIRRPSSEGHSGSTPDTDPRCRQSPKHFTIIIFDFENIHKKYPEAIGATAGHSFTGFVYRLNACMRLLSISGPCSGSNFPQLSAGHPPIGSRKRKFFAM